MSARPDTWMPMFWGDYARDTGHLNAAGHGAYLMLIKHFWCTGEPLVDDDDDLWRIACCDSKKDWLKLRPKIVRLFIQEAGTLRHKRIEKELSRAEAAVAAKAEAGKRGAEKRWQKDGSAIAQPSQDHSKPMAQPMERHDFANATSSSPSSKEGRVPPKAPRPRDDSDSPEFVEFWSLYPRKDDKGHARKAFTAACRKAPAATIIAGLKRYQFNQDPQFRPLPATWLNGERWTAQVVSLPLEQRAEPSETNPTGRAVTPVSNGF